MSQMPNRPIILKTGKPHTNSARRKPMARASGIRAATRTQAGILHIERVKALPCCITGQPPPSEAHHILEGRIKGRKSADWTTIPLAKDAHTGPHGIHGDKALWRIAKKTELECLADTLETLYG